MLPYKNRLISSKDFQAVYRYGRFFSFGAIFLKTKKNNVGYTRVGFSVGVNFSKKAVERNRAKRQLREGVKKNLDKIKKGLDIVIMLKKRKEGGIGSELLPDEIENAFKKGNLIS